MKKIIVIFVLVLLFLSACRQNNSDEYTSDSDGLELISILIEDINDTGYMVLVNRQHSVIEINESKFVRVNDIVPTIPAGNNNMLAHSSAMTALEALHRAIMTADVGSPFGVTSAFRSFEEQESLLAGFEQDSLFIMPVGHSEHHTGLALDIGIHGMTGTEFGNSSQGLWLRDNAYRYGFILRYPEHAVHITEVGFEPWHFRYIGRVHAYFMKQNNFVFEEYITFIQEQTFFYFEKDGITYYILHQVPQNGTINVPRDLNFMISNDNTGGYIVTAW